MKSWLMNCCCASSNQKERRDSGSSWRFYQIFPGGRGPMNHPKKYLAVKLIFYREVQAFSRNLPYQPWISYLHLTFLVLLSTYVRQHRTVNSLGIHQTHLTLVENTLCSIKMKSVVVPHCYSYSHFYVYCCAFSDKCEYAKPICLFNFFEVISYSVYFLSIHAN